MQTAVTHCSIFFISLSNPRSCYNVDNTSNVTKLNQQPATKRPEHRDVPRVGMATDSPEGYTNIEMAARYKGGPNSFLLHAGM